MRAPAAPDGLGKLLNTIKSVQKIHNAGLGIEGMLLTMYDSRLRLSNQVVDELKKNTLETSSLVPLSKEM